MTLRAVYFFLTYEMNCFIVIIYYLPIWLSFATFALLILYFSFVLGGRDGWDEKLWCFCKGVRALKRERDAQQFAWRRQPFSDHYPINSPNLFVDSAIYYGTNPPLLSSAAAAAAASTTTTYHCDPLSQVVASSNHPCERNNGSDATVATVAIATEDNDTDSEIDEGFFESDPKWQRIWRLTRCFQCRRKYIHAVVFLAVNGIMFAFLIGTYTCFME